MKVAVYHYIPLNSIRIPKYMSRTRPKDEKIAKRFLEFYHTGRFDTNIALDENGVLVDGYSAYLVARRIGLSYLLVIRKEG